MTRPGRRQALGRLGGGLAALGLLGLWGERVWALDQESGEGRVIEVEARRFQFTPGEIRVRPGELITLALHAVDFTHGFSLPELGLRTDLMPGRVVRLRLPSMTIGRYTFLCDNFCGDGHEQMNGILIVEA